MTQRISQGYSRRRWCAVLAAIIALWVVVQLVYRNTFIYHDIWRAGFPLLFKLGRDGTCAGLAGWVGGVDTGSPLMLYVTSSSLTHVLRLPALYLIGCLRPGLVTSMYLTQAQIIVSYLAFAGSMFILGCVLFERRLAAVYLLIATLYAGLFLDVTHSDQVLTMLFWIPWVLSCIVLAYRQQSSVVASRYLNGAILFLCLEALDQYPHFPLLAVAIGMGMASIVWPGEVWAILRRHARRLWPAAIVLVITALQLAVIKTA